MADLGERAVLSSESRDNKTKRDDDDAAAADPSDAKRNRTDSTQPASVLYKPQSDATRRIYEGLRSTIQLHLSGQPFDVVAGVAHGVLAALKNHQLDPGDKKKAIDRLFRCTIPNQLFDYLVYAAYYITDFHSGSAAGNAAATAPPAPAVDATIPLSVQDELGADDDDAVTELDDSDMDFILSLDGDEEDILYKPQTNETRTAYKALLNIVTLHISRDNRDEGLGLIAWVTDKVLATLKNGKLNNTAKKKAIDERLDKIMSSDLFDQLVSISKLLTDYHGAAAGDAAESEGRDSSKTRQSRGTMDTSSSSEPVSQEETEMKQDERTAQILSTVKRQKIQIMRDMLDLQKREMEWRKKQHEEKISLIKKDIELREKQVEAKLITAEAGIMAIDIQTVPPYMKSYYIGMQRQIMERRGFTKQLSFVGQVLSPSAEPPK